MARTPQSNEAFFREVDDEVRREKLSGAVQRYGVTVAAVVVIALIALGAYLAWQHHRIVQAGERGEAMTAAMSSLTSGNAKAARQKLDALVAEGAPGYAPLSRLLIADMGVQAGQNPVAAADFMKIADDAAAPQPIRDLALVRATTLSFDTLKPADVIARMRPLTVPGQPWYGTAGELTALAQMKLGQGKQAGATFAGIAKDKTVPQTLRSRAAQLAGDLGIEVVQPADSVQP